MMNPLIRLDYWEVLKNIQPSKFNQGYYVDIRKMLYNEKRKSAIV